jgi:hypothetical protein
VADLYSRVHREAGPLRTFTTREDAEAELERVFGDEPTWASELWVEPFEVVVACPSER